MELVGGLLVLGEEDDGVLEGEEDAGVHVEGEMQVERATAPLFGVQVDLPDLAQRIGLDEVPLVVHVKPVVDRMVLQVGDVSGDVNCSHNRGSLMGVDRRAVRAAGATTADRVRHPWTTFGSWMCSMRLCTPCVPRWTGSRTGGPAGGSPGSTGSTWRPTGPRCPCCTARAWRCSPRSRGLTGDGASGLLAVIDPVDGSTNAHRGVPFYSTSICVLDAEGPRVGLGGQPGHRRALRRRAGRRRREGRAGHRALAAATDLGSAIVGISGFPGHHPGWAQFRALGAASLECCAVAEGVLDAYLVVGGSTLYGWDYLAGLLVCREAGAAEGEREGGT